MLFSFSKKPVPVDDDYDFQEEIAEEFEDFVEEYEIYGDNEEDY